LDALTANVFLHPSLRQVDGTNPLVFEVGHRARQSTERQPRRRAGVLFPDGQIERAAGAGVAQGRYMFPKSQLVAEIKGIALSSPESVVTNVRLLPRFAIGNGAVIVHKGTLPIIVQCPKVAAHRSEIREPVGEIDRE
jgi:hypothetical protein